MKMESFAGVLRSEDKGPGQVVFNVPAERRVNETRLEVRYSPTLAGALVDMAETNLLFGEPLPRPDPSRADPDADLEEPIHLLLTASSRVEIVPKNAVA